MSSATRTGGETQRVWLGALAVALAVVIAYANGLTGPFVFDDGPSIVENESIRSLVHAWRPPVAQGETVGGRPLLNFTFALNFAAGGLRVGGYHAVNVAIHLTAALLLFGCVRRTILRPGLRERWGAAALPLATASAGLWAVHPIQTAAVTYIVQRAESLCAVAYLLTLYAFIRATEPGDPAGSPRPRTAGWFIVAVFACAAGMACKEVMVTAPITVLLYDRTFVAASWREVVRRWSVHLSLAATWVLLGWLVASTHGRAGSAGFAASVNWIDYARTQIWAVGHYVALLVWPRPLVFDYGTSVMTRWSEIWPAGLATVALAAGTVWALRHRAKIGILCAWFFLLLAPSSSVVPVATQTVAEHRVYLASAPLFIALVLVLWWFAGRKAWAFCGLAAIAAIAGTTLRNRDYADERELWADTVAKRPENARAQLNLGVALAARGETAAALERFRAAVRLAPTDSDAHNNLANALSASGQGAPALEHYAEAVRLGPGSGKARLNFGRALAAAGRLPEAQEQLTIATRIEDSAAARVELGRVLDQLGDLAGAEAAYRSALDRQPQDSPAEIGLGEVYARTGRTTQAEAAFRAVLARDPGSTAARSDLGRLLLLTHRAGEAVPELETALRLGPDSATIRAHLGAALVISGRPAEGQQQLEAALRLDPDHAFARDTLQRVQRWRERQKR